MSWKAFTSFWIGILCLISLSSFAGKPTVEELSQRVDELERLQLEKTSEASVKPFTAKSVSFGGFSSTTFTHMNTGTRTENTFTEITLDLLISAQITERLKFFGDVTVEIETEAAYENAPWRSLSDTEEMAQVDLAQIEYRFSDRFFLRFGRMVTPFGIINVERFEPLLLTHDRPLFIRGGPMILFEERVNGLEVSGVASINDSNRFGYFAYTTNTEENSKALASGGRVFWNYSDLVTLGTSFQHAERYNIGDRVWGHDLKLSWEVLTLKLEYLSNSPRGQTAYFIQPAIEFFDGQIVVFFEYDYLNEGGGVTSIDHDNNSTTNEVPDIFKKQEFTFGLNYLPMPALRTRLEYTKHDYLSPNDVLLGQSRDYEAVYASATVSF